MDQQLFREAERRLWESVGVTPVERYVSLDRLGSSVRVQEVGDGPPVLFIHGVSNSGISWATLAARLPRFRCLMLDRPGCGLSEPLQEPSSAAECLQTTGEALVVDVLNALGIARAHVIATSYGGYFALRGAALHPERVDRIVVFGWLLGAPTRSVPFLLRLGNVPSLGRLMSMIPPNRRAVRMMLTSAGLGRAISTGRFTPLMVDTYLSLLRDTDTMRNELRSAPRAFPLRGAAKVVFSDRDLSAIRSPSLFLWGEKDPLSTPVEARAFVGRIPGARLEIVPSAGHAAWIDELDDTSAATRNFLAGLPTAALT